MNNTSKDTLEEWYEQNKPAYEGLTRVVISLLERLLDANRVDYLNVSGRVKSKASVLEKARRKGYSEPNQQMTDISGIRIISYLESDIDKIAELIQRSFDVADEDSMNKTNLLGVDRTGYRSIHFICKFGADRASLPEFTQYKDMQFELQVRTVLQHAWAELAHDRGYKFTGSLPEIIQRRLNLYSGLLEIADSGFNEIAKEIDSYSTSVKQRTAAGDLDIEINNPSLSEYLPKKVKAIAGLTVRESTMGIPLYFLRDELDALNIVTLQQLDDLFSQEFISAINKHSRRTTYIGLLRDVMMFNDIEKYFSVAYQGKWGGMQREDTYLFESKYGRNRVMEILNKYDIELLDD